MPSGEHSPLLLSMRGVRKVYPSGTVALSGVDLRVGAGEVVGLVGANGAGKSTLIKVLSGAVPATDGAIEWEGASQAWAVPADAQAAGVATVYQHIPLAHTLTVIENVFLGRTGWRRSSVKLERELAQLLERIGYAIDPHATVEELSIGQRQMVAILQGIAQGARLLVLDEPTASLARGEREVVFEAVRRLSKSGTAVLYVTHFLDEILDLTDRVTVLRDGRVVADDVTDDLTEDALVRSIVGRELLRVEQQEIDLPPADAPLLLEVEDLRSGDRLQGVSLRLRAGEIVGIAGLLGSGRSELLHAIFGADPDARGTVRMEGRELSRSPRAAVAAGLALVPEDRGKQALFPDFEIWRNASITDLPTLSRGRALPDSERERERARDAIRALKIKAPGPDALVGELSGGNAQKVVFAKWMYSGARVFLLDEPGSGIDIGAKADIVELVRELARSGAAVLVADSEFSELLAVSHRVLVLRRGRVVAERASGATSDHELVGLASGLEKEMQHAA
ncbi:sugar ABC transporter ATP-binding protein [Conexibacter stalactiti]|uniref:Sugar ABC transporter ATP-binding protein n=1 Tax=Conexibacter stalactiti TaxID=1940611 RepID=A0ABU4HSD1_9ACTN|nr:sugar ABC transporter ATP-binding protein [Conexibacter stalactiti]MDW5596236.1 sugar ABC transporter ATP-binding protein [Conexibacter stalactiti]MEC5036878.1 sugar ABC transporter ATP-binding protein [Conexibacter stalactiti]